jgi:membrane-associated phospholipid phosphatase
MERSALGRGGRELVVLDRAVYAAVQATPSPTLDRVVAQLSRAADHSKIWLTAASVLGLLGGDRRRRAALVGITAVAAASGLVNVAVKPVVRRERPQRLETVRTHVVPMPTSASYPSGHAASAFAFSTAVGGALPELDTALRLAATAVGYSRVHTGVHYPGDVIAGAVIGAGIGSLARRLAQRVELGPRGAGRPGSTVGMRRDRGRHGR